jgi:hypothetical protein
MTCITTFSPSQTSNEDRLPLWAVPWCVCWDTSKTGVHDGPSRAYHSTLARAVESNLLPLPPFPMYCSRKVCNVMYACARGSRTKVKVDARVVLSKKKKRATI